MPITRSPPWYLEDVVLRPPASQQAETFDCQIQRSSPEKNLEEADAATSIPFLGFIKT